MWSFVIGVVLPLIVIDPEMLVLFELLVLLDSGCILFTEGFESSFVWSLFVLVLTSTIAFVMESYSCTDPACSLDVLVAPSTGRPSAKALTDTNSRTAVVIRRARYFCGVCSTFDSGIVFLVLSDCIVVNFACWKCGLHMAFLSFMLIELV